MKRVGYLAAVALSSVLSVSAFAQNAGGGGAGGGNNPGQGGQGGGRAGGQGGGGADRMAEWRERQAAEMKESLGATDDEYKALQPKIEKVQTLQRQNFGGFGGRGGGGGRGPGGGGGGNNPGGGAAQPGAQPAAQPAPTNPLQTASQDLRTVLDNKEASAADIKAKLDALRAAKAKNRDELTKAQTELKELLSQRQEAVLVQRGILE